MTEETKTVGYISASYTGHRISTTTGAFASQSLSTVLTTVNYRTLKSFFVAKQEVTQARAIPNM